MIPPIFRRFALTPVRFPSPVVKDYLALSEQLAAIKVADVTETHIYSDLLKFFSRYYDKGDFCTLRRYSSRNHKYMVPYDGQEVMLHWANRDQYYIKTGERFTDYRFQASPHGGDEKVLFKLEAANTPDDNNKSTGRYFIVPGPDSISYDADQKLLTVRFAYRQLSEDEQEQYLLKYRDITADKRKTIDRSIINEVTENDILGAVKAQEIKGRLLDRHPNSSAGRTILGHHLNRYTAANTHDYFIHKNLEGFLEGELDFFLKNEVLKVDDFLTGKDGDKAYERELLRARAVRHIARRVIQFLAQIENFQKRLFEKKKFVTETNWCVTLDHLPESLYSAVLDNEAQLAAWFDLYAIDQWDDGPKSPSEIDEDFLRSYPAMMVDTAFFGQAFKDELLAGIENLEEATAGLLLNGENFQWLNLLQGPFWERINTIYIDPPYNTDSSPIAYKNGFKSSSWIALMENRLEYGKPLLQDDGVLVAAIDDVQQRELGYLLSEIFADNELGTICVRSNPSGRPTQTGYAVSHEYLLFAGKSGNSRIGRMPASEEQLKRFSETDDLGAFEWRNLRREGSDSAREARTRMYYPIVITGGGEIRVPKMKWQPGKEEWRLTEELQPGEKLVYPDDEDGEQKRWRWSHDTVQEKLDELAVRKDRSGRDYIYYKRRANEEGVVCISSWFDAKYSATEHGSALLKAVFGTNPFSFPKSLHAVADALRVAGGATTNATILDYFAGSGTTGHAVIDLNREDDGDRKYILVEMGEYFDTVLRPRIQKVVFAKDWKDGVPQFDGDGESGGVSHIFKYQRLESYEDALNNITLNKPPLEQHEFPSDYMLGYILDVESRGSATLLNRDAYETPFDYKLLIQRGEVTPRPVVVDLQETFHYLIGMRVETMEVHEHQGREYRVSRGQVPGTSGLESAVVIWRNLAPEIDWEKERDWARDELLTGTEDRVYVNGPSGITGYDRIEYIFRAKMDPAFGEES